MSALLRERLRAVTLPDGRCALVVDAEIPDAAPQLVREGLARRAIVNSGGTCRCGATWPRLNREQRRRLKQPGVTYLDVVHEADCPAGNDVLVPAIRAWQESTR